LGHMKRTQKTTLYGVVFQKLNGPLLTSIRGVPSLTADRDIQALAERGGKFKSLHDPWADTTTPQGELLVTILAGFATFERHLIKARTDDGRKRAQSRGVRFGRPRKLDANQRQEALARLTNGETLVDVARTFAVDPTTIGRLQSPG